MPRTDAALPLWTATDSLWSRTPASWRPFFFGANLTALQKKSGGVRPIAVGCTLRRLAAKVIGGELMDEMGDLLAPWQLGYGVRGGGDRRL